ncbi:hypothetical protein WJX84_001419 [Apatococcus fuscideae]|uniref:Uncharacterized protein n=1 Tax=Apatococcus fuscideae TaxID=2026836 RepID=A0AAW1SKV8_9CHLO
MGARRKVFESRQARLQQSGHRDLGVEASLRLILWNLRFHMISRQSLKELRLVELILKFRNHPNRMIEAAARQLLACGIWFEAYREAIGDPLPLMTDASTGPRPKKLKRLPKPSPPRRIPRTQPGVNSPLDSSQPSSTSDHSHPASGAPFSSSSAGVSEGRGRQQPAGQEGTDSAEQQADRPSSALDVEWAPSQPARPLPRPASSLQPSTLEGLGHARQALPGLSPSGLEGRRPADEDLGRASKVARLAANRSPHRTQKKSISLASLGSRHNADDQPVPWQEDLDELRGTIRKDAQKPDATPYPSETRQPKQADPTRAGMGNDASPHGADPSIHLSWEGRSGLASPSGTFRTSEATLRAWGLHSPALDPQQGDESGRPSARHESDATGGAASRPQDHPHSPPHPLWNFGTAPAQQEHRSHSTSHVQRQWQGPPPPLERTHSRPKTSSHRSQFSQAYRQQQLQAQQQVGHARGGQGPGQGGLNCQDRNLLTRALAHHTSRRSDRAARLLTPCTDVLHGLLESREPVTRAASCSTSVCDKRPETRIT